MDFTFINGKKIGNSMGKLSAKTKIYKIPKDILKIGENNTKEFLTRVFDRKKIE